MVENSALLEIKKEIESMKVDIQEKLNVLDLKEKDYDKINEESYKNINFDGITTFIIGGKTFNIRNSSIMNNKNTKEILYEKSNNKIETITLGSDIKNSLLYYLILNNKDNRSIYIERNPRYFDNVLNYIKNLDANVYSLEIEANKLLQI